MRLDVYIFERSLAQSRTEAKSLISDGAVTVDGKVITKPSFDVASDNTEVLVDRSNKKYVSRGGFKLEGALFEFNISPLGKRCLDIGASSCGFKDCLLKNWAVSVIALDSGTNQLVDSLRQDLRVTVIENYNARYLKISDLPYTPELTVMDVSFISATYIIPSIYETLITGGDFICLIKPQFEVGKSNVGKGGIVKSDKARLCAIDRVVNFAKTVGFSHLGTVRSPIEGGDGNIEFLAHFKK